MNEYAHPQATLETSLWDSAELLATPEDIAAYVEAALEDGDPSVITHALGVVARRISPSPRSGSELFS